MYDNLMFFHTNDLSHNTNRIQGNRPGSVNIAGPVAKIMPSRNALLTDKPPVNDVNHSNLVNGNNFYGSRANKRQAPSTVSAEAYLASRISLRPVYLHNEMITRIQNVSNLSKNPPRFKDQVDIIA